MMPTFFDVSKEYAKNANLKKEDVQTLIQWANNQPHLPSINEAQAILFLQRCDYNVEEAKLAIDIFFSVRTHCSDIFLDRNPTDPVLMKTIDAFLVTALPKKTPEGSSVILTKVMEKEIDFSTVTACTLLKHGDMVASSHLHKEETCKDYIMIVDMENCSPQFMVMFNPFVMKKFVFYLHKAFPVKVKDIHFLKPIPFMEKLITMMKSRIEKKFDGGFYLHSDIDGLYQHVPKECLPKDYGGSEETTSVLHENMKRKLLENVSFFEWEDKQLTDESKRVDKTNSPVEMLEKLTMKKMMAEID